MLIQAATESDAEDSSYNVELVDNNRELSDDLVSQYSEESGIVKNQFFNKHLFTGSHLHDSTLIRSISDSIVSKEMNKKYSSRRLSGVKRTNEFINLLKNTILFDIESSLDQMNFNYLLDDKKSSRSMSFTDYDSKYFLDSTFTECNSQFQNRQSYCCNNLLFPSMITNKLSDTNWKHKNRSGASKKQFCKRCMSLLRNFCKNDNLVSRIESSLQRLAPLLEFSKFNLDKDCRVLRFECPNSFQRLIFHVLSCLCGLKSQTIYINRQHNEVINHNSDQQIEASNRLSSSKCIYMKIERIKIENPPLPSILTEIISK